MIATIRIYGTDEAVALITPLKSTLDALGDIDYYEIEALRIDAGFDYEGETKEFINYFRVSVNRIRGTYTIIPPAIQYPSSTVAFETIFPFASVLTKSNLFLWLNDYPITCYADQTTKAIRVHVSGEAGISHEDGTKQFQIELSENDLNRERD